MSNEIALCDLPSQWSVILLGVFNPIHIDQQSQVITYSICYATKVCCLASGSPGIDLDESYGLFLLFICLQYV